MGDSPLGQKELDTTEHTHTHTVCQAGGSLCLFFFFFNWSGQKVGSGSSLGAYETQMNFWPIISRRDLFEEILQHIKTT